MMFATLSFFSIPLLFENKKKSVLFFIMVFAASIILFSLVLAGNRMPIILFIFFFYWDVYFTKIRKINFLFFSLFIKFSCLHLMH